MWSLSLDALTFRLIHLIVKQIVGFLLGGEEKKTKRNIKTDNLKLIQTSFSKGVKLFVDIFKY